MTVAMVTAQDEGLLLTAGHQKHLSVIKIERLPISKINLKHVHYVANGRYKGIYVNKQDKHAKESNKWFTAFCIETQMCDAKKKKAKVEKETRFLRFWFKKDVEEKSQETTANMFFTHVMDPELFPADYTSFIIKCLVQMQRYTSITKFELVIINKDRKRIKARARVRPKHLNIKQTEDNSNVSPTSPERTETTPISNGHHETEEEVQVNIIFRPKYRNSFKKQRSSSSTVSSVDSPSTSEQGLSPSFVETMHISPPCPEEYPPPPPPPPMRVSSSPRTPTELPPPPSPPDPSEDIIHHSVETESSLSTFGVVRRSNSGSSGSSKKTKPKPATKPKKDKKRDGKSSPTDGSKTVTKVNHMIAGRYTRKLEVVEQNKIGPIPEVVEEEVDGEKVEAETPVEMRTFTAAVRKRYSMVEEQIKRAKFAKAKVSLLWVAKKQMALSHLEEAYPNSLPVSELFRRLRIKTDDLVAAAVMLKTLQDRGLIKEMDRGTLIRTTTAKHAEGQVEKVVHTMPTLSHLEQPKVAIISALYCEKLAVDAMIDEKVTYVRYKTAGEAQVYTLGRIGSHVVVSTKLSRIGSSQGAAISAGNTATRLLGIFNKVEHVFLVGVGGGVVKFPDPQGTSLPGDVVVSAPSPTTGAMYTHCDNLEWDPKVEGAVKFTNKNWTARDQSLQRIAKRLRATTENDPERPPWEKYIEEGIEALKGEEACFNRPERAPDTAVNGEGIEVLPPQMSQPNIHFGLIAAGKALVANSEIRNQYAVAMGVTAFDNDYVSVLDSLDGNRNDSFIIVRGIADFEDGQRNKAWQPHAALSAAAYMKALIETIPALRISVPQ